jgi:hypothetical protein
MIGGDTADPLHIHLADAQRVATWHHSVLRYQTIPCQIGSEDGNRPRQKLLAWLAAHRRTARP